MIIIIIGGEGSFPRENFESSLLASLTKDEEGWLNMSSCSFRICQQEVVEDSHQLRLVSTLINSVELG